MTENTKPAEGELGPDAYDAFALAVASTDPGPEKLTVEDEPDPVKERNPSPRPEDGAQDQTQDPADVPAEDAE